MTPSECNHGVHFKCEGCGWRLNCEYRKGILVKRLLDSVVDFEKVDNDVANNGWNGENGFKLDCCRADMISTANEIRRMII